MKDLLALVGTHPSSSTGTSPPPPPPPPPLVQPSSTPTPIPVPSNNSIATSQTNPESPSRTTGSTKRSEAHRLVAVPPAPPKASCDSSAEIRDKTGSLSQDEIDDLKSNLNDLMKGSKFTGETFNVTIDSLDLTHDSVAIYYRAKVVTTIVNQSDCREFLRQFGSGQSQAYFAGEPDNTEKESLKIDAVVQAVKKSIGN